MFGGIETLHAIDVFFIIMALSIGVATVIGGLIGWHVFGIARDAHKIVQTVREEGEEVIHEAAVAAKGIVEEKATELKERLMDVKIKKPRKKGERKIVNS